MSIHNISSKYRIEYTTWRPVTVSGVQGTKEAHYSLTNRPNEYEWWPLRSITTMLVKSDLFYSILEAFTQLVISNRLHKRLLSTEKQILKCHGLLWIPSIDRIRTSKWLLRKFDNYYTMQSVPFLCSPLESLKP